MKEEQNIIIFDCETGGLSSKLNPITEIALLVVEPNGFKEVNRFETFVRPYANLKIEQQALDKTNITLAEINKGIEAKELVGLLIKFFQLSTPKGGRGNRYFPLLAGHNVSFDVGFLKNLFDYSGKNLYEYVSSSGDEINRLDTLILSRLRWKNGKKHSLSACCERIGIDITDAHRAMNDVLATKKLLEYLISNNSVKENIKSTKAPDEGIDEVSEFRKTFEF
ncbi:MAG TPA: 3'-5' exonuclease [Candidatus Kapabacteria bacterium]|nr:3'-5' exonuclease [Candidatus Kapabacteria bacterium]